MVWQCNYLYNRGMKGSFGISLEDETTALIQSKIDVVLANMVGVSLVHSRESPKLVKPTWTNFPEMVTSENSWALTRLKQIVPFLWTISGPPESPLQVVWVTP